MLNIDYKLITLSKVRAAFASIKRKDSYQNKMMTYVSYRDQNNRSIKQIQDYQLSIFSFAQTEKTITRNRKWLFEKGLIVDFKEVKITGSDFHYIRCPIFLGHDDIEVCSALSAELKEIDTLENLKKRINYLHNLNARKSLQKIYLTNEQSDPLYQLEYTDIRQENTSKCPAYLDQNVLPTFVKMSSTKKPSFKNPIKEYSTNGSTVLNFDSFKEDLIKKVKSESNLDEDYVRRIFDNEEAYVKSRSYIIKKMDYLAVSVRKECERAKLHLSDGGKYFFADERKVYKEKTNKHKIKSIYEVFTSNKKQEFKLDFEIPQDTWEESWDILAKPY